MASPSELLALGSATERLRSDRIAARPRGAADRFGAPVDDEGEVTMADEGRERALVLAGGGVTGIAWELGLLHGLAAAGVDLRAADLVVGTSAGAAVGAQVCSGAPLDELYARQRAEDHQEIPAEFDLDQMMEAFADLFGPDGASDPARARLGAKALAAATVPESDRRAVIEWRLPDHAWSTSTLLRVTAIDTATGELVVFDRDSGVGLVDAIGASCAVPMIWPPVTIGDRRYMDGGVRSPTNADLAAGYDRVVVIAPLSVGPVQAITDAEVAALEAAGATVQVVQPDEAAQAAMGENALDPSRRPAVTEAGDRQAPAVVEAVADVWV